MRVVQTGYGSPRPLLLVYHLAEANDAALIRSAPANALIVNDTRADHYVGVLPLPAMIAQLSAQVGAQLGPVVLAGFSEGGLVTKRLLDLGADPSALVIADGTYGADYVSWKKYAERARRRERAMLASYSAGTQSPWQGLKAITGFPLVFGPALGQAQVYQEGSLAVLGYPDGDHNKQGSEVLPKMVESAFLALADSPPAPPTPPKESSSGVVAALAGVLLAGAAAGAVYLYRRRQR